METRARRSNPNAQTLSQPPLRVAAMTAQARLSNVAKSAFFLAVLVTLLVVSVGAVCWLHAAWASQERRVVHGIVVRPTAEEYRLQGVGLAAVAGGMVGMLVGLGLTLAVRRLSVYVSAPFIVWWVSRQRGVRWDDVWRQISVDDAIGD